MVIGIRMRTLQVHLLQIELESLQDVLVFLDRLKDKGIEPFVFQFPVLMAEWIVVWIKFLNLPVERRVDSFDRLIQMVSEYFHPSCLEQWSQRSRNGALKKGIELSA